VPTGASAAANLQPSVQNPPMNRTDRLYALVEDLRASTPRPRTAQQLADRFEVSVRTIERDLSALQQSGVPIWATPGPNGGYSLDPQMTLPPVNFTPAEAAAISIALGRGGQMPYASAARSAMQKVVAAMSDSAAESARDLADRILLINAHHPELSGMPTAIEDAVTDRAVIEIDYEDRSGVATARTIEPVGFVGSGDHWYLVGWCRLRNGGRSFRVDRIRAVRPTGERAEVRPFESVGGDLVDLVRRPIAFE